MKYVKNIILLLFMLSCSVVYAQKTGADLNQQTTSIKNPIIQEDYKAVLSADGLNSFPFNVLEEWEEVQKIQTIELQVKKERGC